jgi:hypothetical protein
VGEDLAWETVVIDRMQRTARDARSVVLMRRIVVIARVRKIVPGGDSAKGDKMRCNPR